MKRVGLFAYCTWTGIGTQAEILKRGLPIASHFAIKHPIFGWDQNLLRTEDFKASYPISLSEFKNWVQRNEIERIIIIETPFSQEVLDFLFSKRIETYLFVNWECFPSFKWNPLCKFIAPTNFTKKVLRERFGLNSIFLPFAMFPDDFSFRVRDQLKRIIFLQGPGGIQDRRNRIFFEKLALSMINEFEFEYRSPIPMHISTKIKRVIGFQRRNEMYENCDLLLYPSKWEGIGIMIYESIASGLPLLTNNIPPINEVVTEKIFLINEFEWRRVKIFFEFDAAFSLLEPYRKRIHYLAENWEAAKKAMNIMRIRLNERHSMERLKERYLEILFS
jgi:hypothetical protein